MTTPVERNYLRTVPSGTVAAAGGRGPACRRWLRENLFPWPGNIALTFICILFLVWAVPPVLRFFVFDAVWSGERSRSLFARRRSRRTRRLLGLCPRLSSLISFTAFIRSRNAGAWISSSWRWQSGSGGSLGSRRRAATWAPSISSSCFPVLSYVLLSGTPPLGLADVPTALWGGILVTIVVAIVGIVVSLAAWHSAGARRAAPRLPVVKLFAVIFIEFVRGVPLITVLFMASVMLPLFVPERLSPDKLVRALIGVALFASAYMAEVVRGGLAGDPARPVRGGAGAGPALLAHDGARHPAAGA